MSYEPGAGDITITLSGESVALKPTLEACIRISRATKSGPRGLADQVLSLDFDAVCLVVSAGTGRKLEDVQKAVFETGTINIFGDCIRFIEIVNNGGRPPKQEEKAADPLPVG